MDRSLTYSRSISRHSCSGFMSTTGDGGSWGGYTRSSWHEDADGDSAPFPRTTSWAAGSLSTPTLNSEHGLMMGPDYEYAKRESAFVPLCL